MEKREDRRDDRRDDKRDDRRDNKGGSRPDKYEDKKERKFEPLPPKNLGKQQDKQSTANPTMIEVIVNDRLGKKVRVKCCPDDTIGDLKKLIAAHTGTRAEKIRLQKSYNIYKDHITLKDYEINHGMGLEMYYN